MNRYTDKRIRRRARLPPTLKPRRDKPARQAAIIPIHIIYTFKRTAVFAQYAVVRWTGKERANYVRRIMIKQIKFVSIPVADQNRALDFYTEKLGFTIITDQPFDEKQRWIELRIPKAETRVVLFTPEGQEDRIGSFSPLVFARANVEATYTELKARGVVFDGPPEKQPWGTFTKFRDSEGNQ